MTSVRIPPSGHDPVDAAARDDLHGLFELETVHRRGTASLLCIARDLEYNQTVALKVMPRAPHAGPEVEEAFHRAAAAVAALDHPGIVPLYSAGATDRFFWCSTEYVEGRSLAESLRSNGPMELSVCLRLVDQVAAALEAAHQLGVVHANLTPANVLIDAAGAAHVTDFWVPWVLERLGALAGAGNPAREAAYRAPEVSPARDPGPRADQYALAALVYVALSDQLPVVENPLKTVAQGQGARPPRRLTELHPGVPRHTSDAVERALAPSPDARFPSVLDFVEALREPASSGALTARTRVLVPDDDPDDDYGQAPRRSKWRWVGAGVLTLAALGAVAAPWLLSSGSASDPTFDPATYARSAADSIAVPETTRARLDSVAFGRRAPVVKTLAPTAEAARRGSVARPALPRPRATGLPSLARPARLFINATPWGEVYLDDHLIGNTPRAAVPVAPGAHRLRVVRDGFQPYELAIRVAPGQELRLTDIVLQEIKP